MSSNLTRIASDLRDVSQIHSEIAAQRYGAASPRAVTSDQLPRPGLETELARLWAEMLGVSAVGAREDFFHLGGHSLLAVRMLVRVRDAYQLELPMDILFSYDEFTIEVLAREIESECVKRFSGEHGAATLAQLQSLSDEEVERRLEG